MRIKDLLDKWDTEKRLWEIYTAGEVRYIGSYLQRKIKAAATRIEEMEERKQTDKSSYDILKQERAGLEKKMDHLTKNISRWFTPGTGK